MQIHANVVFSFGDVKIFRAGSVLDAHPRDEVFEEDIIKTDDKAQAVIQISDRDVISISENSELQIKQVQQSREVALFLRKGEVLSKVTKLSKGDQYIVRTPTLIAGVRGTSFSVTAHKSEEKISVLSGKVVLDGSFPVEKRTVRGVYADEGQTVQIDLSPDGKAPRVVIQEIREFESAIIKIISDAEILPDSMKMTDVEMERIRLYYMRGKGNGGGTGSAAPLKSVAVAQTVEETKNAEPAPLLKVDDAHVIAMAKSEEAVSMKTFVREGAALLFAEDSDVLRDQAKALIDKKFGLVAGELNKNSRLIINGYSEIGTPITRKHNIQLSYSRAYLVAKYLVEKYGFVMGNLAVDGKGPDDPISTDLSEEGRKLNRRVEISLAK